MKSYEETLDFFAGKALQGLLANPKLRKQILKTGGADAGWIEKAAYGWAEAMMEERIRRRECKSKSQA